MNLDDALRQRDDALFELAAKNDEIMRLREDNEVLRLRSEICYSGVDVATAIEAMRAKCEAIADAYAKPGRFKPSETWKENMTVAEVYATAVCDVSIWLKDEIAALKGKARKP